MDHRDRRAILVESIGPPSALATQKARFVLPEPRKRDCATAALLIVGIRAHEGHRDWMLIDRRAAGGGVSCERAPRDAHAWVPINFRRNPGRAVNLATGGTAGARPLRPISVIPVVPGNPAVMPRKRILFSWGGDTRSRHR